MKSILLTLIQVLLTLFLYVCGAIVFGVALTPAIYVGSVVSFKLAWPGFFNTHVMTPLELGLIFGLCYFIFGLSLTFVVGIVRLIFGLRLKEGDYKIGSAQMLKWYFVNALFLSVRTVFMDFLMLTPFCALFYRMMGAKLGRNVQINSKNVADHSLLELGDNVVIGGNATVIGHLFESKGLRLAKVTIGKNVIIGLNSVIMPGVTIGEGSVVAAGAIVPKGTTIEAHTIYFSPDKQVKK